MSKWLEIIGLTLLLAAFGWECLAQTLSENKVESSLASLHQNMDILWEHTYTQWTQSPANTTTSNMSNDINIRNKHWDYYEEQRVSFALADRQEEFGQMLKRIIYVVGSVCLIIAKTLEPTPQRK